MVLGVNCQRAYLEANLPHLLSGASSQLASRVANGRTKVMLDRYFAADGDFPRVLYLRILMQDLEHAPA